MNHKSILIIVLVLFSTIVSGQDFVEIDRISWGNFPEGATMGSSDVLSNGWSAVAQPDCDGTGFWGVRDGVFVIEDTEGTCGCPCVAGEPTPSCGANDNTIIIPGALIAGYCKVRISFTVSAFGDVECGSADDQLADDFRSTCLANGDPEWAGTDGMSISFASNLGNDTDAFTICGTQGVGTVVGELDVEFTDQIVIFITAGTQEADERYEISDIVFEAVERKVFTLNASCLNCESNTICENNGLPITLQTIANESTSTFQWSGPGGFTSTDPRPEITDYTPASSGVYSVTVTEDGTCTITDEITITVLPDSDSICKPRAIFANLFGELCSNVTLPAMDDNLLPGTWSPSADLLSFADSTLTFTFTPDDDTFSSIDVEIEVFDENDLATFGVQPPEIPVFCNRSDTLIDFIDLFQLNLDVSLQIQADGDLLPFITNGDFVNNFVAEFQTISLLGLQPGVRRFFIDGASVCGIRQIPFRFEIVEAAAPIIIDTSLCFGDTITREGLTLFGGMPDTVVLDGSVCGDTVLIASVALTPPGRMNQFDFFPVPPAASWPAGVNLIGGGASFACEVVYLYDTIIGGQRGVLALGEFGADPPLGPNYDTIFTENVSQYAIPFLEAANSCDTIVNLNLLISAPVITVRSIPLCQGTTSTANVEGVDFLMDTESNTFERVPVTGNCTFVDLVVDILPLQRDTITSATTRIFRAGQDTTILGVLFNEANPSQEIPVPNGSPNGCNAFTFVNLIFAESQRDTIDTRICPGQFVAVGDTTFLDPITDFNYTLNIPAANGGDSIVNVTIDVLSPEFQTIDTTICSEGAFVFMGETYNTGNPGGSFRLTSPSLGCDSIIFNIILSFFDVPDRNIDTSFCEGSVVNFPEFGITIDENNLTAQTTDVTADGCIRQVNITGTVLNQINENIEDNVCRGETYFFGSRDLTQNIMDAGSGVQFSDMFPGGAANGCDSTVILDLTILDPIFNVIDTSICAGTTFLFNGVLEATTDTYFNTVPAANGCDSVIQLNLTVDPIEVRDTMLSACSGQEVDFRGQQFDRDTVITINEVDGLCSVLLRVTIDILDPIEVFMPVVSSRCADGTSVMVGSNIYDSTGIYRDTFESFLMCDSIVITELMIPDSIITGPIDTTLCGGDFFTLNGQRVDDQGINDVRFFAANGCDSIVRFNLDLIAPFVDTLDIILCPEDEFGRFNDIKSNPADTSTRFETVIFESRPQDGCDTTLVVNFTLVGTGQPTINGAICSGDSLVLGNRVFRESIRDVVVFQDTFGCTQTVRLDLNVFTDDPLELGPQTICEGDGFIVGDSLYTEGGPHTAILPFKIPFFNSVTCDSIITFSIVFQPPVVGPLQIERICAGDAFPFGDLMLDVDGTYFDTLTSLSTSCDSIVELSLTVVQPFADTIRDIVLCPNSDPFVAFNGETIVNDGSESVTTTGMQSFMSNSGCDTTIVVFFTLVRGENTVNNVTVCDGVPFELGDSTFTTSGQFFVPFVHPTFSDCDSVVELNLTVISDLETDLGSVNRCQGETFMIGDSVITTSGPVRIILASKRLTSDGTSCDSIVTAELNFQAPVSGPMQVERICAGDVFPFGDLMLDVDGTYFDTLTALSTSCDSIVELSLTVVQPFADTIRDIVLCPNSAPFVAFNGETIVNDGSEPVTTTGMQSFMSNIGCDTTIVVFFTLVRGENTVNNVTVCDGVPFELGDSTFTTSGQFFVPFVHPTFSDCDSVVELNLTVISDLETDLGDQTICAGESFMVGGSVLTTAGTQTINVASNRLTSEGLTCDSMVTVNLIIETVADTSLMETICEGMSFTVGTSVYMNSGMTSDTLTSAAGCDSIVNLSLIVITPELRTIDTSICFGNSIMVGDQLLDETAMREVIVLSVQGCDSLIFTVNLTVLPNFNSINNAMICPGQVVSVGTSIYDEVGTFFDTLTSTTGCDSIIRTNIELTTIEETTLERSICTGQTFDFGGQNLSMSGTFRDTVTTLSGCDSILILTLNIVDQIETPLQEIICDGQTTSFGGRTLSESGMYSDTLSSVAGCDSIVTLDLTVTPPLQVDTETIVGSCDGVSNGSFVISDIPGSTGPYTISGLTGFTDAAALPLTVTGLSAQTYNYTVTDANRCSASATAVITNDRSNAVSIVSVEIDPAGIFDLFVDFDGQAVSVTWDNVPGLSCYDCPNPQATISEATTFTVTVEDVEGCVSIASINLTVDGIGNIYVPSVFNPESENGNDRFFIQGEDPDAFYDLWIYDRWGNLVYSIMAAPINDRESGWNGRWGNEEMNPGVFVFTTRIFKANGIETTMNGDITIIR